MSESWAIVDGHLLPLEQAVVPVTDLGLRSGWSVFETFSTEGLDRLECHLSRLERSCGQACIAMPCPDQLAREVRQLVERVTGPARLRVTLTGSGARILTAEPYDLARRRRPVRAVRGVHRQDPVLGGAVKHGSRAAWVVALQRSGVDEVLSVDAAGRFTEGTTSAVVAVIDGVLWTAPHDGRVLPSVTVLELLERAAARDIAVRREGPPAHGAWDALYIASSLRDLAPVVELDGESLPEWDPIGQALIA